MRLLRSRVLKRLYLFRVDSQGSALVEFALISVPLVITMLFGIEIGIRLMLSANVNAGATAIIRQIDNMQIDSTGYGTSEDQLAQGQLPSQEDMVAAACNDMGFMLPCNDNVVDIEARVIPNQNIIEFQVIYRWTSIVPAIGGFGAVFEPDVRSPLAFAIPRQRAGG